MGQVTGPLTINDGAATPVARTFSPEKVSPEESVFVERSAGVSAGYQRLKVGYSPANANRPTNRVDVGLTMPVLQTINGVSSVAYTARFEGKFVLPDVATPADRANIIAFVKNALGLTLISGVVKDLDPLY